MDGFDDKILFDSSLGENVSSFGRTLFEPAEAQREQWQHQQIERARCNQSSEDNDSEWSLDLLSGRAAAQGQRAAAAPAR